MTTDAAREALAASAGLSPRWTDNSGAERIVAPDVLAAALAALGLPADSDARIAESRARLDAERAAPGWPPLIAATLGAPTPLPAARPGLPARVEFELGGAREFRLGEDGDGRACLPGLDRIGYHRLLVAGQSVTLAVAPHSARSIGDVAQGRKLWGLAAQIYGLSSAGDGGFGDFGAVAALCEQAARRGADMLMLSPAHALYAADAHHFAPYSPSSRLFANALHADPALVLGTDFCAPHAARFETRFAQARASELIDWPDASRARLAYFRALFDAFVAQDSRDGAISATGMDFARFRAEGGRTLERHAIFEALHADEFSRDFTKWNWRDWPAERRDAASPHVAAFARARADDVLFHIFLQWLVDRSWAAAQGRALAAGMRVGLVADLAIGMNAGGSHAWSEPGDLLLGLSIGAPPDALAPRGQNWGLTTFSPRALRAGGFAPFLSTLRATLRNSGGARIDHIMGVSRLWLTPDGCEAMDGVYLAYPTEDLLALLRLESARHGAIVIGEDLGTVPYGLRDRLGASGVAGLRVMLFERDGEKFYPPHWYPPGAVAMPTTHDTATFSGWWRGHDIDMRAGAGQLPPGQTAAEAHTARVGERATMWRALEEAGTTGGAPCPAPSDPEPALDAAFRFLSASAATLVVAPLEDALGLAEQPNLPGTTDEHPNWRRRYPSPAASLLDAPQVAARLSSLAARG